ncbi:winged helix-turn-helix domain-containing protein [Streptomyces sp. NPDC057193]|uniref:winged helix-turn-helix domain-containing protein n=1 Tax=Streptomyces sp. NPDC057193 TaxID=3346043 RepID=UPI003629AFF7
MAEANPRGTYMVIATSIRTEIEDGAITEALPSEAALMGSLNVSRNTVRRALKVLEAEGVVESAPGLGWRVVSGVDRRPLVARLTDVIALDSLGVGDAFPSESKLCERFGASRTAVRHALAQMEGSGLLDTVHGKGRTVRALPVSLTPP